MNSKEHALRCQLTDCYNQHKQALLRSAGAYATPYCPGEDILQEALCTAVRRILDFPAKGCSWDTWLKGLIRTAGMDLQRRQRKKHERVKLANDLGSPGSKDAEELAETVAGDWDLPDEAVSDMEDAQFLAEAMAQLSREEPLWHRVIVALHASNEPSYAELSSSFGLTTVYIRQIYSRAIKRLRDIANELRNR